MLFKRKFDESTILYIKSSALAFGWAFLVFSVSIIPIIISFIQQSLLNKNGFQIDVHIENGNLLIISIGLAGAAWVDSIFSNHSNKTYRIPDILLFFIVVFIITAFITIDKKSNESFNNGFLMFYSYTFLFISFLYAVVLKSFLIAMTKLEN